MTDRALAISILLVLLLPAVTSQAYTFMGKAGPFDVYGNGHFYYAVWDPGNFDYVYRDRFYVKRFHSGSEYVEFIIEGSPWAAVARALADVPQGWSVGVDLLYPWNVAWAPATLLGGS